MKKGREAKGARAKPKGRTERTTTTKPLWLQTPLPIYLEIGSKKVFACSVNWLGWSRAAKTEEAAIEALAAYTSRYASVAENAGMKFFEIPPSDFEVVERLKGNATTEFGAPGIIPDVDRETMTPAEAMKSVSLLEACWKVLDDVIANAPPNLKKGPRGGGRDRDAVFSHVLDAENSYARAMGVKIKQPDPADRKAVNRRRAVIIDGIITPQPAGPKAWPPHYVVRRMAWHVLDHAWEIEDKSEKQV